LFLLIFSTIALFGWQSLAASTLDCSDGGVCFPSDTGLSESDIGTIIGNILSWALGIFGVLALIAFVVSGIQYLVSGGNEDIMKTAKRNMTYSIIGVLVALSGFVIIQAIDAALKASSTTF